MINTFLIDVIWFQDLSFKRMSSSAWVSEEFTLWVSNDLVLETKECFSLFLSVSHTWIFSFLKTKRGSIRRDHLKEFNMIYWEREIINLLGGESRCDEENRKVARNQADDWLQIFLTELMDKLHNKSWCHFLSCTQRIQFRTTSIKPDSNIFTCCLRLISNRTHCSMFRAAHTYIFKFRFSVFYVILYFFRILLQITKSVKTFFYSTWENEETCFSFSFLNNFICAQWKKSKTTNQPKTKVQN